MIDRVIALLKQHKLHGYIKARRDYPDAGALWFDLYIIGFVSYELDDALELIADDAACRNAYLNWHFVKDVPAGVARIC